MNPHPEAPQCFFFEQTADPATRIGLQDTIVSVLTRCVFDNLNRGLIEDIGSLVGSKCEAAGDEGMWPNGKVGGGKG
jgi:hypothetical protein